MFDDLDIILLKTLLKLLLTGLLRAVLRLGGWLLAAVAGHDYPGGMLMKLRVWMHHPFSKEARAERGFYEGWAYADREEPTAAGTVR